MEYTSGSPQHHIQDSYTELSKWQHLRGLACTTNISQRGDWAYRIHIGLFRRELQSNGCSAVRSMRHGHWKASCWSKILYIPLQVVPKDRTQTSTGLDCLVGGLLERWCYLSFRQFYCSSDVPILASLYDSKDSQLNANFTVITFARVMRFSFGRRERLLLLSPPSPSKKLGKTRGTQLSLQLHEAVLSTCSLVRELHIGAFLSCAPTKHVHGCSSSMLAW